MFNHKQVEEFGNYLYSRLPEYYRMLDSTEGNNFLERFLEVLNRGGFAPSDDLSIGLLDLSQISKCPEEYLDTVGHSLGVDWIRDVKEQYKRRILRTIVELYRIKGTKNGIEHIARSISGFDVEVREGTIPEADFEPGDENKRLTTIQLYSPHFDDYDPSKTDMDLDTIKYVVSYFVPVHTKFVVILTYFYHEIHDITQSKTDYKAHMKNGQGEEVRNLESLDSKEYNTLGIKDSYITNMFPNYNKQGVLKNSCITKDFTLSPFISDTLDGYLQFNKIKRNEGEEFIVCDVEEFIDFNLNLVAQGEDFTTIPELDEVSKINLKDTELCDIINLKEVHFTPRLTFAKSTLNSNNLMLTPRNELDICKVNKNGEVKIIFI